MNQFKVGDVVRCLPEFASRFSITIPSVTCEVLKVNNEVSSITDANIYIRVLDEGMFTAWVAAKCFGLEHRAIKDEDGIDWNSL